MGQELKPLAELQARLSNEIAEASRTAQATPMERFVAEALTSDDAKAKGLVDRVWVVSLPDARKAIAAVEEWNRRALPRPVQHGEVEGMIGELRRAGPTENNTFAALWNLCARAADMLSRLSAVQQGTGDRS